MDLVTALAIVERARRDFNWSQRYPLAYQRALHVIDQHTDEAARRANDPNALEAW